MKNFSKLSLFFSCFLILLATSSPCLAKISIAVLPFENISADPKFDWLKQGMAETLSTDLKCISEFQLIERVQVLKAISEIAFGATGFVDEVSAQKAGKIIGAQQILVGGFQIQEENIRVTARIIEATTGKVLNTFKVDGLIADLFSLQDEIVKKILEQFDILVTDEEKTSIARKPTANLEAYRYYIKGLELVDSGSVDKAVEYYKKSIEIDPQFTTPYRQVITILLTLDEVKEAEKLAKDFLNAASTIKDDKILGDAYLCLVLVLTKQKKWKEAEKYYNEGVKKKKLVKDLHGLLEIYEVGTSLYYAWMTMRPNMHAVDESTKLLLETEKLQKLLGVYKSPF